MPNFNASHLIEPRDVDWDSLEAIKAEIPPAKRKVTRQAETVIPGIINRKVTAATTHDLQKALLILDERMNLLEALLDRAAALDRESGHDDDDDDGREDSYFAATQEYLAKTETAKDAAANFLADQTPTASAQSTATPTPQSGTREPRNPEKLLAPETLIHGTTGEKLNEWIGAFSTFLQSGQNLSTNRQHGYFNQLIDANMKSALRGLHEPGITPMLEPCGVLDILKNQSLVQYPIFNRRLDYFGMKRGEGENALEYLYKLDALASEANISAMTPDDITLHVFMAY